MPGDAREMPFLDHLEELRARLFRVFGALAVGIAVGFVVVQRYDLVGVLARPAAPYLGGGKLVYINPADPFNIVLMMSLAVGVVLALPVIAYQGWAFVAPALHRHERRLVVPVLAAAMALFLGGVALAYFFVLPATLKFFAGLAGPSLQPMITAAQYFSFAVTLALTFGAAFELPILITALSALGLVTPAFLREYRRHAVVLCFVASSLLTPGDALTATVALVVPLYLLYEVSIVCSAWVHRWRARREAALGAPDGAGAAA